ncbi:MAG: ABC transporter permease [Desulfobulbia bacterium]
MLEANWLTQFPAMDRSDLVALRKWLDTGYRQFTRNYGETVETFFDPLLYFLVWFENLLITTPWIVVLAVIVAISYGTSRSIKLSCGVAAAFVVIGYFGMWEDTMRTLSIIAVATALAIILGVPVGIMMARSNRVQYIVTPVLDVMQTMPAFVYLIPVVMLLGIGKIPGIIAVLVYAIPPVIRLTNLGIRQVDPDILEAATAFGCTKRQRLLHVQIPLSFPTIMAGINQTIMMSLAMVVIASMIGVKGLGQPVLKSITNQYFTMGLLNGLAIVALAIMFDRISQAYARRVQKHLKGMQIE